MPLSKGESAIVAFVVERQAILTRRKAGQPFPWTADPILRDYRFCCIRREDDRVTKEIASLYREPYADHPDLWFALLVARRAVNKPSTLAELGFPVPWDADQFKTTIRCRQAAKLKTFRSDAYGLRVSGEGGELAEALCVHVLNPLWSKREYFRPRPADTLGFFAGRLAKVPNMGSFFAAQVVADLKYVQLRDASDWRSFALSGPGSRPGLDRVRSRAPRKYWSNDPKNQDEPWLPDFHAFCDAVREPIRIATGLELDNQDLQSVLCEFHKYCRGLGGDTKGLKRYVYQPERPSIQSANKKEIFIVPDEPIVLTVPDPVPAVQVKGTPESPAPPLTEEEQQVQRLNARWRKIAGDEIDTPKWSAPGELSWRGLLEHVPFVVLYEDCLRRLHAYRSSVATSASVYLQMIVLNDGPKFMAERGLRRPTKFSDEEDITAVQFVSKKTPVGK